MIADPYPTNLAELDELPASAESVTETDRLIRAINRLAQAVEQDVLSRLHPATGQPNQPPQLAPLPAVQTVAQKPGCPLHGVDRVAPSTNGKGGFYCQSKAGPGQPANPKGYCTWHS